MGHSITKQLAAQFGGALASRGNQEWTVILSAGTTLYHWSGRRLVPSKRLEHTESGRVVRRYGRHYVVKIQDRQILVLGTDVMLVPMRPFTKDQLSNRMNRVLVHDYMKQKRIFAPYVYERMSDEQAIRFANQTLEGVWYVPSPPNELHVKDVSAFEWDQIPASDNRSFRLQVHYWTTVSQLTRAFSVTGEERYLAYAEQVVLGWVRQHPALTAERDRDAYHEHGTAIRVFHLLGFIDAYRQTSSYRDPHVTEELMQTLYAHAELLSGPALYRPRHNHGIFQDMALFAIASCFPEFDRSAEWERVARIRLEAQLEACITEDGTHLEHSPGYHVYVYHILAQFVEWASLNGFQLPEGLEKVGEMPARLVHMIKPNRTLPMVGDTGGHIRGQNLIPHMKEHPQLAYAVSGGTSGTAPLERMVNVGRQYAVMREYWQHTKRRYSDATYIMMTAGFHSHAHKHADDLSVELYGLGRDFIVETGRYGYSDRPERSQALRVTSHNTVHRFGEELDLSTEKMGGSEIVSVEEVGKTGVASGVSRLIAGGVVHERKIVYDKARTLVVYDRIAAPEPDMFVQRFHLAPDLRMTEGSTAQHDVRFQDDAGRSIQIVQLLHNEESYMALEDSRVSTRDFEWTSRRQVVTIEYGEEVCFLTLIRLDRMDKPIVQTRVEEKKGAYIVTYWLKNGAKHVIHVPLDRAL